MSYEDARLLESVKQWDLSAHPAMVCRYWRSDSLQTLKSDQNQIYTYYIKDINKLIIVVYKYPYHIAEFVSE